MRVFSIFLVLVLLYLPVELQAHQPDLSSIMLVEQSPNNWVVQIRSALTAFEVEVNKHYGEESYPTAEKFKELVIMHLSENVNIYFDEQDPIVFKNPYVKLGHETSVVFEVSAVPDKFNSITVKNTSFEDIHRNQSALFVIKKGFSKDQFILTEQNKHTAKLNVVDSKFVLFSDINKTDPDSQNNRHKNQWQTTSVIAGVLITILLIFFWKKDNQNLSINLLT